MRTRASQACRQRARARHCRRWLAISLFASWLQAASAADPDKATPPASVIFDERFLKQPDGLAIDVSRFARGNPVSAGQYTVDQYLNGGWLGRNTVQFQDVGGKIVPCIGPALISQFNLDESVVSPEGRATLARASTGECVDPGAISSDVTWTFDLSELRLDISVPQALLRHTPRGYVGPEFWDAGIPSATLGYNFNTFHSAGTLSSTTTFLGIDAGVNLGTWHLRQRSSMTWQTAGRNPYDYQNLATYLQHDIPSWRGQLTLGDAFTDGAVFDSFGVRGVQIASDDRMLPDSMRGYAPLIRGIAQTNARVTVTQNGNKLYETTVAPGPFEINDLYATGYGGNLQVTVTEADGSQHSFAVPYASVAQLIRPGITRFSVAAGQYRDTTISSKERLVQATVQHGFTNLLTGYAGVVLAEGYQAGLIGAGFNTPVGALAVDVTQAKANIPGVDNTSGQSLRVSYSKFVPATNTNVAVAAYRYSSSGFWQMRDTFLARDRVSHGGEVTGVQRQRSQMQLTLNQTLGGRLGSVYVTGTSLSYWNRNGTATQYQLGYSNFVRLFGALVTLNLSASRQREVLSGTMSTQIFAGITVPLGSGVHAPLLSLGYTNNSVTGSSEQLLLNGTALEDNSFSYGLSANHASSTTTGGGNVQYRSPYATVSASASGGSGYSQYSAGVQGALVVHPGGLTLANYLGDTIGIVEAKDAKGARITNSPGVRIDGSGYAVVPYLTPYSLNSVELDPKGLPLDVELKATSALVAPRANSVVKIQFATISGRAAIIAARRPDGKALPFGATVTDEQGSEVGAVGQGGRIFVHGIEDAGQLQVKWDDSLQGHCWIPYQLPPRGGDAAYVKIDGVCHANGNPEAGNHEQ